MISRGVLQLRGALQPRGVLQSLGVLLLLVAPVVGYGCRGAGNGTRTRVAGADLPETKVLPLPITDAPHWPSLARTRSTENPDQRFPAALFADTDSCARCHEGTHAEWTTSAHAHSSFDNPWYRAVVDDFRSSQGFHASEFCAGCHDPLLLFTGAVKGPIDGQTPLHRAGVTCLVCHSIDDASADGNGSYTLRTDPVPIPDPEQPGSLDAHRDRLAGNLLRSPRLCGSCHRGFLGTHTGIPHHMPGLDELEPWRASAYGGSHAERVDSAPDERTCQECHMERRIRTATNGTETKLASHRFVGAHTAMAASLGDTALRAQRENLRDRVEVDLPVLWVDDQPWIVGDAAPKIANGQRTHLRLDVTIHNRAVGHAFPGGVQDTQDTWLEVLVMDGSGRVIASAGEGHTDAPDPTAYVLRSTPLTDAGLPEGFHRVARFRAMGWNHTIGPRATRIVQYDLPWEGPVPERFSVQLTLRHRRHHQAFGDFACAAQQSPRGRDFGTDDTTPIDACAPFPITTLTHRTLRFGPTEPQANLVERLRRYADATLDGPLEYLGQGERIVEHALHRGPAPAERGALLATAGAMAARQGRLETALERIAEAESLLGSHPYLERVRGQAFARVWRWSEAATHFKRATELAPGDSSLWTERAQAEVSIGDSTSALASVHRGLALVPRNGELLRLLHGATESPEALETFLAFRGNDRAHVLREECDRAVPGCQATRQPIVRIPLRRPLH